MNVQRTVLEAKDICKSFYGNLVLNHVNFSCLTGEIHTLIGENGAGKSTLMRIFSGVFSQSSGEVLINGQTVCFENTLQAQKAGISIIHQEFNLVSHLSIAENIFLGRPEKKKNGNIDFEKMRARTRELSEIMNMSLNPDEHICNLTVAQQQMVEIMKAIELDTKIIIMDEPTAALTAIEIESLFSVMKKLRDDGRTIIYISHRLNEVFEISDRITVLKDGAIIATKKTEETSKDEVISLMVGRKLENIFPLRDYVTHKRVRLEVKDLVIGNGKTPVSFVVNEGEILGITGLEGQGQREILRSLFGLHRPLAGEIMIDGKKVIIHNTKDAIKQGITFLTDDRKNEGLCLDLPIYHNICLPIIKQLKKGLIITAKEEKAETAQYMNIMNIKAESSSELVKTLSGGNQQKVLLGKCLSPSPKIFLIHEPTRGIDVAAKIEIYTLLRKLAREEQVAIVMVSSDLMEILNVSDRIIVIYNGGISGELKAEEATEEKVMRRATNVEGGLEI